MITKRDKQDWCQINFRVPKQYKRALKQLADVTGVDLEEIGAEAIGAYFGNRPLDTAKHRLLRKKIKADHKSPLSAK